MSQAHHALEQMCENWRILAEEIRRDELLAEGTFGSVWKGIVHGCLQSWVRAVTPLAERRFIPPQKCMRRPTLRHARLTAKHDTRHQGILHRKDEERIQVVAIKVFKLKPFERQQGVWDDKEVSFMMRMHHGPLRPPAMP